MLVDCPQRRKKPCTIFVPSGTYLSRWPCLSCEAFPGSSTFKYSLPQNHVFSVIPEIVVPAHVKERGCVVYLICLICGVTVTYASDSSEDTGSKPISPRPVGGVRVPPMGWPNGKFSVRGTEVPPFSPTAFMSFFRWTLSANATTLTSTPQPVRWRYSNRREPIAKIEQIARKSINALKRKE